MFLDVRFLGKRQPKGGNATTEEITEELGWAFAGYRTNDGTNINILFTISIPGLWYVSASGIVSTVSYYVYPWFNIQELYCSLANVTSNFEYPATNSAHIQDPFSGSRPWLTDIAQMLSSAPVGYPPELASRSSKTCDRLPFITNAFCMLILEMTLAWLVLGLGRWKRLRGCSWHNLKLWTLAWNQARTASTIFLSQYGKTSANRSAQEFHSFLCGRNTTDPSHTSRDLYLSLMIVALVSYPRVTESTHNEVLTASNIIFCTPLLVDNCTGPIVSIFIPFRIITIFIPNYQWPIHDSSSCK
jgi:hypothetical protein